MIATRSREDPSTAELVKEAADEARELIRIELTLAKNDLASEWRRTRFAAIAFAIAVYASSVGLAVLVCALGFAARAPVAVTVVATVLFFVTSGLAVLIGYWKMPTNFLGRTRERLESDVRALRDVGGRHGRHEKA